MTKQRAEWISRAELAKRRGVSSTAITKACRGPLKAACSGKRVNVAHPAVVEYLESAVGIGTPAGAKRSELPPPVLPSRPHQDARRPVPNDHSIDADLEALTEMLQPLLDRFGTTQAFKDYLNALKTMEEIRKHRLDNEVKEGSLIERELVRVHVFGAIEQANRKLLGELPKNLARTLYSKARSGIPVEESEADVRKQISELLAPMKVAASRNLRRA